MIQLPYKINFQPDYVELNQKIATIVEIAGKQASGQPSQQLEQLLANIKEEIVDQELQFHPDSIYTQYATLSQLKQKRKKVPEVCTGCGQDIKKSVQCEFCAQIYCKGCCSRKRVIPGLSQNKQFKLACEDCHFRFVKLLHNQKFYAQSQLLLKVIEFTRSKYEKSESKVVQQRKKNDDVKKLKIETKIKQNNLLKELKNEQKSLQQAKQKLQAVVNEKAELIRKQRQILNQKKKAEQQQENRIKMQKQKQEKSKESQNQSNKNEQIKKLKQDTEKYQKQIEIQRQKIQKILKQQQEAEKKRKQQELKQKQEKEAELLRIKLAEEDKLKKQQQQKQKLLQQIKRKQTENRIKKQLEQKNKIQQNQHKIEEQIGKNSEKNVQQQKPKIAQSLIGQPIKQKQSNQPKQFSSTNKSDTQARSVNEDSVKAENKEQEEQVLPIINVAQMTVNQLLRMHVNPNDRRSTKNRVSKEVNEEVIHFNEPKEKNDYEKQQEESISDVDILEAKKQIFRTSSLNRSSIQNISQNHTEQEMPAGQKCACSLM